MKTDNPARTRKGFQNTGETGRFKNSGPAGGPGKPDSGLATVIAAWDCLDDESRAEILMIVATNLDTSEVR